MTPSRLRYNDRQHAYWVDGARCKSVSAVAKIPDSTFAVDQWRMRQIAIGMVLAPHLREAVAAHFEDKQKLNELCEEALTHAKAHSKATTGTAVHRITEKHDRGETVLDTELSIRTRESWQQLLDATDLEVVPEYIERIVLYPEHLIAGRFDRLMRRKSDGTLVVVDLKSGQLRYPHSMAVQLALYANAPFMTGPIDDGDVDTDQFEPPPDNLDRTTGYIFHIPSDGAPSAVALDLTAGWDCFNQVIVPTLRWRARTDLTFPFDQPRSFTLNQHTQQFAAIRHAVDDLERALSATDTTTVADSGGGVEPSGAAGSPSPQAPTSNPSCVHGERVKRTGTNTKGTWTGLFCPLPKERKAEQCDPVWV